MKIIPQQSRLTIEPIDEGGVIVNPTKLQPDEEGKLPDVRWRVIAVGTGRVLDSGHVIEIPLKAGDEVVLGGPICLLLPLRWYGDKPYAIVDYAHVQCKIEREEGEDPARETPKLLMARDRRAISKILQ